MTPIMLATFVHMWICCFAAWIMWEVRLITCIVRRYELEVLGYTP